MTEQLPKDPVTLDDLKRAIDHYEWASRHALQITVLAARSEAWRAAFEWRGLFGDLPNRACGCKRCNAECAEYDEGMRLIREKLQS